MNFLRSMTSTSVREPLLDSAQVAAEDRMNPNFTVGSYDSSKEAAAGKSLMELRAEKLSKSVPRPPNKTLPLIFYQSQVQHSIITYHATQSGNFMYAMNSEDIFKYDLSTMQQIAKRNYKDLFT